LEIENNMILVISKKNLIRIIVYVLCAIAVLIFWIHTTQKVKSLHKSYQNEETQIQNELKQNFSAKIKNVNSDALSLGLAGERLVNINLPEYGLIVLNEALARSNEYRDLYLYTAKVCYDLKDYERAKELALKSTEIDPVNAPTYTLLAQIYFALGDEENSQICYNKAKDFER